MGNQKTKGKRVLLGNLGSKVPLPERTLKLHPRSNIIYHGCLGNDGLDVVKKHTRHRFQKQATYHMQAGTTRSLDYGGYGETCNVDIDKSGEATDLQSKSSE